MHVVRPKHKGLVRFLYFEAAVKALGRLESDDKAVGTDISGFGCGAPSKYGNIMQA